MDAKEARKITEANINPFENIIKFITDQAGMGLCMISIPCVPINHQIKLVELGYKISKGIDTIGLEYTKIEW